MADETRKQALTKELVDARAQLGDLSVALRRDLSFGARMKSSVARRPVAWFGGAGIAGFILSMIATSRSQVVVKAPRVREDRVKKAGAAAFALTALKFGLDFAKPAIMRWMGKNMMDRFSKRAAGTEMDDPVI